MDKIIIRLFKILSVLIMILGVVFFVLVLINADVLETNLSVQAKVLDPYANLMYITLLITAFLAVFFPLMYAVLNPKQLIKFLIILAGLVLVGFLAYSLASNTFNAEQLQRLETTAQESRIVGAGLIFTYFVAGLTVLSLLVFSVFSFFKR